MPRCTVGSRQAEHESQESRWKRGRYGKEYGNGLVRRRTDEDKRAAGPRELIKRCQKTPYNIRISLSIRRFLIIRKKVYNILTKSRLSVLFRLVRKRGGL